MNARERPSRDDRTTPADRLESWKEIAVYLRRGVRTVRRWEKEEGLPIHRQAHKKLGTVYAHRSELDAWRDGRRAQATGPAVPARDRRRQTSARVLIAVLPFEDQSGNAEQEYIADGLTDEMISELNEQVPMWTDAPPGDTLPLALEAAERALGLNPNLAGAYASLGLINANYLWDWPKAEGHFQRALALDPNCSPARLWYAEFLGEMGRIDDALATLEWARTHDPLSRSIRATRAFVLWLDRRYDEAIAEVEQVLEIDPTYTMALIRLGVAYAGKGLYPDAVRAFRAAEAASPELLDCIALQGYAHARAGSRREALKQQNKLRRLARRRYVPAFLFSGVYLGLGEHDEAVRYMEQEYDARGRYLLMIKHGPQFDTLRSQPRFQALVGRMNFPP